MPSVIIDTNIFIRALLKPTSSDGKVFREFLNEKVNLYYSPFLISEIGRVLTYPRISRKYRLSKEVIDTFIITIMTFGKMVQPTKKVEVCRDKEDNELLSLAYTLYHREPVFIITADQDLLVLKNEINYARIITPQEFLKLKKSGK